MIKKTLFTVLLCAALTAPASAYAAEQDWRAFASMDDSGIVMVDALAAITAKASLDLLGRPADIEAFKNSIRRIAWKTRSQIITGSGREAAEALRHAVFTAEGMVPDQDFAARAEPATAVLSEVIEQKRGVCLSLSLIYLAAADEALLPVHGVSVPTHFFVRYDDGRERLNLETLDRGNTGRSDNFYRRKFLVRKGEPFYLRNLSRKESLAVYLSQLAALYSRAGRQEQAIELLEVAKTASPSDPEVRTNLGVALDGAGRPEEAIRSWREAVILDPYDDVAHYHLARALADRGEWLAAIHHFDESMRLGHDYDVRLLRRLEPHRPDALYVREPRAAVRTPSSVVISQEPKA